MFIVGKLSNEYRKEHKNEQEYMCSFYTEKPEILFAKDSYTTYGSLLEALEELYDRLVCLPDDSTGEREKRLLDYAACLCCGALYTVKGFDREGDDDD